MCVVSPILIIYSYRALCSQTMPTIYEIISEKAIETNFMPIKCRSIVLHNPLSLPLEIVPIRFGNTDKLNSIERKERIESVGNCFFFVIVDFGEAVEIEHTHIHTTFSCRHSLDGGFLVCANRSSVHFTNISCHYHKIDQ